MLLKFNLSGSLIWTRQTGTSGADYAYGVFIDVDGSVYVTGYTNESLNGQPWAGDNATNSKFNYSKIVI